MSSLLRVGGGSGLKKPPLQINLKKKGITAELIEKKSLIVLF